MRSRMDRYNQLDHSEEQTSKRSSRNQELYRNLGNNTKYTNFTDVTNSNAILIDNNRDNYRTREGYQQRKEYGMIADQPKSKKELDDFNYLYQEPENRVYDINSILEQAKENRKERDLLEEKRKLKNTNYNILASLNPEELEKYRKEKQNRQQPVKGGDDLRGLIDTITSKTLAGEISKETGVDLLSDLMATSAMDKVTPSVEKKETEKEKEEIAIESFRKEDLEELEKVKDTTPVQQESDMTKDLDRSFYTKSMDLSDKDFLFDGDEDDRKVPVIVKVLLILILLSLIAIGACFLFQSFS